MLHQGWAGFSRVSAEFQQSLCQVPFLWLLSCTVRWHRKSMTASTPPSCECCVGMHHSWKCSSEVERPRLLNWSMSWHGSRCRRLCHPVQLWCAQWERQVVGQMHDRHRHFKKYDLYMGTCDVCVCALYVRHHSCPGCKYVLRVIIQMSAVFQWPSWLTGVPSRKVEWPAVCSHHLALHSPVHLTPYQKQPSS